MDHNDSYITLSVYLNSVSKMFSFISYKFYHMLTKYWGYLCLQRFITEQGCERSLFSFHQLPWAEGFLLVQPLPFIPPETSLARDSQGFTFLIIVQMEKLRPPQPWEQIRLGTVSPRGNNLWILCFTASSTGLEWKQVTDSKMVPHTGLVGTVT